MVYPGAEHTRFHHALGALKLMSEAIANLRAKGVSISTEEEEAALIAIMLHDIGHGPFSHALEETLIRGVHHEQIGELMMERLNTEWDGKLTLALDIFRNRYAKPFLHQLVSGQLDMDRMDYLMRDSFYTGVAEGIVSFDRILRMLNVVDGELVVEEKGVYSIEKFLVARRLMYWQVYLHKAVVAAEDLLVNTLAAAVRVASRGGELFCTPALGYFLYSKIDREALLKDDNVLEKFCRLDDHDIWSGIKQWQFHSDKLLAYLAGNLINRRLPSVSIQKEGFSGDVITEKRRIWAEKLGFNHEEIHYVVHSGVLSNQAYNFHASGINVKLKSGDIVRLDELTDNYNLVGLMELVTRHYLCTPKSGREN